MKKNILLIVTSAMVIIAAFCSPQLVAKAAVDVQVTSIMQTQYSNDIYATGVVEELSKKNVIAELPLVAGKVYYQVGDSVKVNDVLADIDIQATTAALYNLTQASNLIPKEYMEVLGSIDTTQISGYIPDKIYSPADGVITSISLVEGAVSTPKATVATISNKNEIRLKLSVSENDAAKIAVNDDVVFKVSATGNDKYLGKVERIFPTASKTLVGTSQATVVSLYVTIPDNAALKPGYTVNGVIKSPTTTTAYVLPYECVLQDEKNVEYVYLAYENTVIRCDVKTGLELGEGVEILSPSLQGQRVIVNAADIKSGESLIKIIES